MPEKAQVKEVDLAELASELIELEHVAALSMEEDFLTHPTVFLKVWGPLFDDERAKVHDICETVDYVRVDGHKLNFMYSIDADSPAAFGQVPLYIPDEVAVDEPSPGTEDFVFKATSLEKGLEGVEAIVSQS